MEGVGWNCENVQHVLQIHPGTHERHGDCVSRIIVRVGSVGSVQVMMFTRLTRYTDGGQGWSVADLAIQTG